MNKTELLKYKGVSFLMIALLAIMGSLSSCSKNDEEVIPGYRKNNPIPDVHVVSNTENIKSKVFDAYIPFHVLNMYLDIDRKEQNAQIELLFEKPDDMQEPVFSIVQDVQATTERIITSDGLSFEDYGIYINMENGLTSAGKAAYKITMDFLNDSDYHSATGTKILVEGKREGKESLILLIQIGEDTLSNS